MRVSGPQTLGRYNQRPCRADRAPHGLERRRERLPHRCVSGGERVVGDQYFLSAAWRRRGQHNFADAGEDIGFGGEGAGGVELRRLRHQAIRQISLHVSVASRRGRRSSRERAPSRRCRNQARSASGRRRPRLRSRSTIPDIAPGRPRIDRRTIVAIAPEQAKRDLVGEGLANHRRAGLH